MRTPPTQGRPFEKWEACNKRKGNGLFYQGSEGGLTERAVGEVGGRLEDFEGFFRREYERLFRAMWLLCGDRAEGEDLAQEAMVRAYERWARVRAASDPTAYVYRIAFNLDRRRVRNLVRSRMKAPGRHEMPDPGTDAAIRVDVVRSVRRLPRTQREALVLVEWMGLTPEEAASTLHLKPASVRVRLHRARQGLRSALGDQDAE